MIRLIFAALLSLGLALPAAAQSADKTAIETTIQNQIEAFRADDFATAFTFASPTIQRLFGTPERFGMMVQQGYPMVWRPSEVEFLGLRLQGRTLFQRVQVRDAAGQLHQLDYAMIETENGWQINGVQMVRMPGIGV